MVADLESLWLPTVWPLSLLLLLLNLVAPVLQKHNNLSPLKMQMGPIHLYNFHSPTIFGISIVIWKMCIIIQPTKIHKNLLEDWRSSESSSSCIFPLFAYLLSWPALSYQGWRKSTRFCLDTFCRVPISERPGQCKQLSPNTYTYTYVQKHK